MQKWEYLLINFQTHSKYLMNGKSVEISVAQGTQGEYQGVKLGVFNQLGDQGWELVSSDTGLHIFKRPKS